MKSQVLRRGVVTSLNLKKGESLRCESGSLWLTFTGDHADYILGVGQICTASRAGKAVIEALSDEARWSAVFVVRNTSPLPKKRLRWCPR